MIFHSFLYVYQRVYLVGGLEHGLFSPIVRNNHPNWRICFISPIVGMMIQSDFDIFQRGWNHQPDIYLDVNAHDLVALVSSGTCVSAATTADLGHHHLSRGHASQHSKRWAGEDHPWVCNLSTQNDLFSGIFRVFVNLPEAEASNPYIYIYRWLGPWIVSTGRL